MGMVLFYIILISPVLIVMAVWFALAIFIHGKIPEKFAKTQTAFIIFSLTVLGLIPTYDIIITNVLGAYYKDNLPKPFLSEKFEKPFSLYVENNVLPYTKKEREIYSEDFLLDWWIRDNIKINRLALKGDDGQIYIYYFDTNSDKFELLQTKAKKYGEANKRNKEARYKFDLIVANKENIGSDMHKEALEILNKERNSSWMAQNEFENIGKSLIKFKISNDISNFDYTIKKEEIKLSKFASKFIKIVKIEIIDNKTSKLVGYNQYIYRRGGYWLLPDLVYGDDALTPLYENYALRHTMFYSITNLYDRK